jgi:hypothetical protein
MQISFEKKGTNIMTGGVVFLGETPLFYYLRGKLKTSKN